MYSVAFSPDGRSLAAAGAGGWVLRWDVPAEGIPRQVGTPLIGDGQPVYVLRFAPDGSMLVSGGADGALTLWDVSDSNMRRPLGSPVPAGVGSVNAAAMAPGGAWLASGGGSGRTTVWDLSPLAALGSLAPELACLATGRGLSPDEWRVRVPGLDYEDSCPQHS